MYDCLVTSALVPGTVLHSRYRIQSLLSESMGTVYQAVDMQTDVPVVIKQAPTTEPDRITQLIAERQTLIRLSHPGIVKACDFFLEPDSAYLVMERVAGRSLQCVMVSWEGQIPEERLIDWGLQVTDILSYLHAQSPAVIYRDLKPEHLILDDDGRLCLIDFGAARVRRGGAQDTIHLGTPGYAAPEQYGGQHAETDERTDVYGLGATLYHVATRQFPGDLVRPTGGGRSTRVPDAREFNPRLSRAFCSVLERCLSPDPSDRYPTASAVGAALRGCARPRVIGAMRAVILSSVGLALLATFTLALLASVNLDAAATLEAHLRRLALNLVPALAPFPLAVWALAAALAGGVMGLLCMGARGRRGLTVAGLALAALLSGVVAWSEALNRAQDTEVGAPAGFPWSVVWQRDLPSFERFRLAARGMRDRDDPRILLATGLDRRLTGLSTESGATVWEWTMPPEDLVGESADGLIFAQGRRLTVRGVRDGGLTWSITMPSAISGAWWLDDVVVLTIDGTLWTAVEPGSKRVLWTRRAAGSIRGYTGERLIVVMDPPGRIGLVNARTGKDLWTRETELPYGVHYLEPGGEVLVWATRREVRGLDMETGGLRYRVPGPVPGDDAEQSPPWLSEVQGTPTRIVAGRNRLIAFDPRSGGVRWTTSLGLERFAGLFPEADGLIVRTRSGRLLALDPDGGHLQWEHWSRAESGTDRPLFATPSHCVAQDPIGNDVLVLSGDSGRIQARIPVEAGFRLRAFEQERDRLYLGLVSGPSRGRLMCIQVPSEEHGGPR